MYAKIKACPYTQLTFNCSKTTAKKLQKGAKYVQS